MKAFNIDSHKFDPAELFALTSDIPDKLRIRFNDTIRPQKAAYDSPKNTLLVRFSVAFTMELQSLIIHELTHALCDKNKYDMDIGQSESMAYIAQCQFAKLRATTGETLGAEGDNGQVFDVGWRLADKVLALSGKADDRRKAPIGCECHERRCELGPG
jgi:hypothetical protein